MATLFGSMLVASAGFTQAAMRFLVFAEREREREREELVQAGSNGMWIIGGTDAAAKDFQCTRGARLSELARRRPLARQGKRSGVSELSKLRSFTVRRCTTGSVSLCAGGVSVLLEPL